MRHAAPAWDDGAERRQGVGRLRPEDRAGARARAAARARTSCSRASAPASPRASASGRTTCPNGRLLLDHRLRRRRAARARAGHDLNYLGWAGVLEDTAPGAAAGADRRPRRRGARRRRRGARRAARARAHRPRRPADVSMTHGSHRLVAHRLGGDPLPRFLTGGARLLPDLRDRRRPPAHRRRARAEVLRRLCELIGRPELAARQFDAGPGGARRGARGDLRRALARRVAASSSTARTSASARSPRSPKAPRRSAGEPALRPLRSGSIRRHGERSSACPDRSGRSRRCPCSPPWRGAATPTHRGACRARRLLAGGRSLCRRQRDHDRRDRHRAGLVARPALDRLRSPGPRQALDEPLRRPPRRRRPPPADAWRPGRLACPPGAATGSCSRTRRARSQAAASTSGRSTRRAASRGGSPAGPPSRSRRPSSRDGTVTFRTLEPGEPFPEKTSDAGTPLVGPRELLPDLDQRAPFRLTIAGTKLGFASATDNVGDGPVWVRGSRPAPVGAMRAEQLVRMSDGTVRTYEDAGRLRYTSSPSHTHWHLLDFQRYELRTLDGELVVRDRKSGFCLADHYGLAERRVTAFTGAHFFGNCAASNPAGALRRAGHLDRLHRPLPGPLPRPEPRAPAASPPVSTCSSTAPTRRNSWRSSTTRTTTPRSASGSPGSGGVPSVETLRRCEDSADC